MRHLQGVPQDDRPGLSRAEVRRYGLKLGDLVRCYEIVNDEEWITEGRVIEINYTHDKIVVKSPNILRGIDVRHTFHKKQCEKIKKLSKIY